MTERRVLLQKMKKAVKISIALLFAVTAVVLGIIIYYNKVLPNNYYITSGTELKLSEIIETIPCGSAGIYNKRTDENGNNGVKQAELKLLGIIPIKTVSIREVNEPMLIPCGDPFGIKLLTDGVLSIEVSGFETDGGYRSPALDAGIKTGDIIKTIDGHRVMSNDDIGRIISESGGKELSVKLVRDGRTMTTSVEPLICRSDNRYRIGLWVRDSSAGIGTMTFYDPETGIFAGLGHPVCDIDTGSILPISKGEAVNVTVKGVKKGAAGVPGELQGSFVSAEASGTLELNCESGLFGCMDAFETRNEAVPLGMRQEVKTGEAYIYTTIDGDTPRKYSIFIERIDLQDSKDGKNMVVRVTDKELLEKTGGIVQGMSGSPIIQNGKLVGAVTHVFVNNPAKGYAIFADTMYDCAKSIINDEKAA